MTKGFLKYDRLIAAALGVVAIAAPSAGFAQDVNEAPIAQDVEEPAPIAQEADASVATDSAAADQGSGDIVVTARKRAESLLDVPVAISALSNETLTRYNVNDLNAMATLVPNVTIVKAASGTGASMTIRGVGSTFNDFGIDQTVSINIDGMQISRGFITNVAFFDVEQVEVLKGPQALFFGKNSPGGVVSVRSKGPGSRFEAGVKAGYEFVADEKYAEGFVSGPISDTFGARLAVRFSDMAGYLHNNAVDAPVNPADPAFPVAGGNGRSLSSDTLTGRLTLEWEPTTDFTATFKLLANRYRDDGMASISQAVRCAPGFNLPTDIVGGVPISDPTGDCRADRQISSGNMPAAIAAHFPGGRDGRNYGEVDSYLATLNLRYDLGPITLESVTGYSDGDFKTLSNYGYTSLNRFPGYVTEKSKLWTQEVRFNTDLDGPIDFAGGVYYENSKRSGFIGSRFFSPPIDPVSGLAASTLRTHTIDNEAISAFGQAIWNITDNIELAGGARFTHETKTTVEGNTFVHPAFAAGFLPAGVFLTNKFKDDNISPEVTLSWKPQPNLNIYAAYKTGYKSGGASIPVSISPTSTADSLGFGAEKAEGGEIGIKGKLFDRRMTFSADVYEYKLKGLQLVMVDTLPNGLFVNLVRNAADARTRGAEFDATFQATDSLVLHGGASYNDAEITNFPNSPCWALQTAETGCVTNPNGTRTTDRAGDPLSKAPKLVLNGGFDFDTPVTQSLNLGLSGQAKYSSSYRTQDDGAPYARQSSYVTIDGTVRVHDVDDRWELALIGRNLTNKNYLLVSSPRPGGAPGELHGVIARPREVALQASFRF